jgi:hypothetical protein
VPMGTWARRRRRPTTRSIASSRPTALAAKRAALAHWRSVDDPGADGAALAAALGPFDRPALVASGRPAPNVPIALAELRRQPSRPPRSTSWRTAGTGRRTTTPTGWPRS